MTGLRWQSAEELHRAVSAGELSCTEAARACLDVIAAVNPTLNALITVTPETALEQAGELDAARAGGGAMPALAGVPVVVKDNICTRGIPTTCGSRILSGYRPPYDATVVERLRAAGAVLVGKANLDEFAMGSSNENSAFGPARNPWDLERVPGGSSGGSAASVAAGMAPLALGSDTGGSIRQPASFCGVVGLRPTYGRVSRYGLTAFASSMDQIGPVTRTVEDNARLFSVISGHDPRDATSLTAGPESPAFEEGVRGLRIGIPAEYFAEGTDSEVAAAVNRSASLLEEAGASLVEVALPHTSYAVATYYIVANAEASSNLARYDGIRYGTRAAARDLAEQYERTRSEGFGAEVKRRILVGTYVLSAGYREAYYESAQRCRTLIAQDFQRAFESADVLLGPAAPAPAFPLGSRTDDPLAMYLSDAYTIPASLAGLPALSFPCGFSKQGLPIGAQLTGKAMSEAVLYRTARVCEEGLGLLDRHPK